MLVRILILAFFANIIEVAAQTSGTWVDQYSGTSNILIGVSAIDDDTAFVCGTGGAFLKTYNGGTQWISVSSGSAQDYYGIDFINGTTGFVVGNNGAIRKTSNGGLNWTPSWLGNTHMRCVRFIDPLNVLVGGANGLIGKSVDGGANWTICSSGTSANVYDIFFISSSTGYAVCFDGSVLITYDGGYNWSVHPSGVTTKLNQIHFTDSLNGILTGSNGVIRRSTDGGLTWSPVIAPGTLNDLGGLEFPDPFHGFASGSVPTVSGAIMETLDGGISWDTVYSSAVSLTGMDFANANTGYVVGYSGKILKYTTATGMAEASTDDPMDIQVFPNPASDQLHVSLKINSNETIRIEVFDLVGERAAVIFEGKVSESSSYTADISRLPGGVYFVKCSGSLCAVRKFVKS